MRQPWKPSVFCGEGVLGDRLREYCTVCGVEKVAERQLRKSLAHQQGGTLLEKGSRVPGKQILVALQDTLVVLFAFLKYCRSHEQKI